MTDLFEVVPALKRAVAPPGRFERFFPEATDDLLAETLFDGLGRAQLDGFLTAWEPDFNAFEVAPDLNGAQRSLIVLYASKQMLEADLRNRKSRTKYEAKGVSSEVADTAASVLVELLRGAKEQIAEVKAMAAQGRIGAGFAMADQYLARMTSSWGTLGDRAYDYNALAAGGT